jgi:Domain of unknown function (DUF1992)
MSFRRIAEGRIREAIEQGVFEDLPGAGKPLNLEEYFSTPEEWRVAFSILKTANCTPPEVELLKEISSSTAGCSSPSRSSAGCRARASDRSPPLSLPPT